MVQIKIGTTCSGRDLFLAAGGVEADQLATTLANFDDHDLFDYAVALECLQLNELRKSGNHEWIHAIDSHLFEVSKRAGPHMIQRVREELGIVTAFAARDHGKKCLAPHFRG